MDKIYVVKYSTGRYDEHFVHMVFGTTNKQVAKNYVERFNNLVSKMQDHYSFIVNEYGYVKDEYLDYFERQHWANSINRCFYEELPMR